MHSVSVSFDITRLFLQYLNEDVMHHLVTLGSVGLKYLVEARHCTELLPYMFCTVSTVLTVSAPLKTVTGKTSVL